jgi:ribosomal protein L37AE/L43A
MIDKHIKCPRCHSEGRTYEREKRYFYYCPTCGLDKLLKELNIKQYDQSIPTGLAGSQNSQSD